MDERRLEMNVIYYFTGTGNSLQIAQDLAKALDHTELRKIAEYKGEKIEAETIGIVYPVYDWGLPLIVKRFLKEIKANKGAYIYAITNFNGMPGKALIQCEEMLKEKGFNLSAGYLIPMPGNYIAMYEARSEKTQQKMFDNERKRVKEIVANVKAKRVCKVEKKYPLLTQLLFKKIYRDVEAFPRADEKFVVTDRCIGCGLCEKGCSVHNIKMKEGKPIWLHHCEMCLGCLQYCPKEAIELGKQSVGKKRYHNPNVKRDFL